MSRKSLILAILTIGLLILVSLLVLRTSVDTESDHIDQQRVDSTFHVKQETKYGYPTDSFHFEKGVIKPNQFLSNILTEAGVNYSDVARLAEVAEDVYSVKKLKAGKDFTIVFPDSCSGPNCFIYEPGPYKYIKYHLGVDPFVEMIERPVDTILCTASGQIQGSLWVTMEKNGYNIGLIALMVQALDWSVDFFHVQNGDEFKLVYEMLQVEGKEVGVSKLIGAEFKSGSQIYTAIHFDSPRYSGFFDPEGRPMKKTFLRSPVQFSRISSSYNLRRFHPIRKRVIPHLGTDYAAAYGTPIRAVADGRVTHATYGKGTGNYVKIRHDHMYETQYLHMSKFKSGIAPGVRVKQGDIIGYVGSTGLSTGPHVCFRFWKNGKQVNHLRENFPEPEPMAPEELPTYFKHRDEVSEILELITTDYSPSPTES